MKEGRPQSVILEVGAGGAPFPASGERPLRTHEYYIGVEPYYNGETDTLRNLVTIGQDLHEKQVTLAALNGTDLPFPDRSIDEVVFCNVLGDGSLKEKLKDFASEAGRVVTTDGYITVVETYSPEVTSLDTLRTLMEDQGLYQVNVGEERDPAKIDAYFKQEKAIDSYIARFSPQKPQ